MPAIEFEVSRMAARFAQELKELAGDDKARSAEVLQVAVRECAVLLADAFPAETNEMRDILRSVPEEVQKRVGRRAAN